MAAAVARQPQRPPPDDLDALFNFDAGPEALERSKSSRNESNLLTSSLQHQGELDIARDIDEQVVVTKKRTPVAKLDEDRILSVSGIPRLRKISKTMRYKGKGHEFSDMTRLLNMYQLWLDDMYPRAKFADGLTMIEKLGHKKKIQIYRKEWIDEGKPKPLEDENSDVVAESSSQKVDLDADSFATVTPGTTESVPEKPSDDHVATNSELPPEDELDALLAEEAQRTRPAPSSLEKEDFDAEEEAMAEMGW